MNQTSKDILINRAIALFNSGQIKKCLKETLRTRKVYPDEPFIYNLLGVLYSQLESYEDSIKNYSKAIKLNPNYIEAITNMAIICEIIGNFTKAEMYFNQALSLDPTNTSVLYNLANCLFNAKEFKQSIEVCQKIIDLDPTFHFASCLKTDKVLRGPDKALMHPFVPGKGVQPPSLGCGESVGGRAVGSNPGCSEIFPRFDFDSLQRPSGAKRDVGAFEFIQGD